MTLRQRLARRRLRLEGIWAILTGNELRLVVVIKEFGKLDREMRRQ